MPLPDVDPVVSVVVATRRRPALVRRCVNALLDQDDAPPFEVLVVNDDDAPLAGLPVDARVRLLAGPCRGVAAARNLGVASARAPLVLFTDDDTIPTPGWVAAFVDAAAAEPETIAFDGPVPTGSWDQLYFHAPDARPGGLCGANVGYRRAALEALGGFDERFTGWMPEDVELAVRARAFGSVAHVPAMVVVHPPRPISARELVARGTTVEGEWLLFRKHPTLSRWRVPLRWSPVIQRLRLWGGLLTDRTVVRGSPVRAVRIIGIGAATTVVATYTAWRRWPGPG